MVERTEIPLRKSCCPNCSKPTLSVIIENHGDAFPEDKTDSLIIYEVCKSIARCGHKEVFRDDLNLDYSQLTMPLPRYCAETTMPVPALA